MTDGRHPDPGCLDAETLAAFIDGRLKPHERAAVEAHLVDCEECYEVWMDGSRSSHDEGRRIVLRPTDAPWHFAGIVAAAAMVVAAVWWTVTPRGPVEEIADLLATHRPVEARLSIERGWAPRPTILRSADNVPADSELRRLSHKFAESAARGADYQNNWAAGLAALALGDPDLAIKHLSDAASVGDDVQAALSLDLSAAHLERLKRTPNPEDATSAMRWARISARDPMFEERARFNEGLAQEAAGDFAGAAVAWRQVVALSSGAEWAAEARARLEGRR